MNLLYKLNFLLVVTLFTIMGSTQVTLASLSDPKKNPPAKVSLEDLQLQNNSDQIKVMAKGKGTSVTFTNPSTNESKNVWAGYFTGYLGTQDVKLFCIDLLHPLAFWYPNDQSVYEEDGTTSPKITYILNNFYPFKGSPSSPENEAAAVQIAIWHYSDNVNANTVTDATIRARALQIIADAEAHANDYTPIPVLMVNPSTQTNPVTTPATFNVSVKDATNNPMSGVNVSLATTSGSLSQSNVTTGSNGLTSNVTLQKGTGLSSEITANASVNIPQGTRYVHAYQPDRYQKLVLATPTSTTTTAKGYASWYGDCDLTGFTTYTPGAWFTPSTTSTIAKLRDNYFSTVFPSGLVIGENYTLTLTSAAAVKNFNSGGGTPSSFTQNYVDVSSTSAGTFGAHLVALTLNVKYGEAGLIGPSYLGELFIKSGKFAGKTVYEFIEMANTAIGGGDLGGYTFAEYTAAATAINENFDNGTQNKNYLGCEQTCNNTIGDFVWHDKNVNGIQDAGEPGIESVKVQLLSGSTVKATTTTDVNGYYSFSNVENGTYTVKIADDNFTSGGVLNSSASLKWYASLKDKGSDDAKDSDGNETSHTASVTINCSDNNTIDFGFFKTCISLEKTGPAEVKVGETITYHFKLENCGDLVLHGGAQIYDAMLNPTGDHKIYDGVVNVGAVVEFNKTYVVKATDCGDLVNTANAIGHPIMPDNVTYAENVTTEDSWTTKVNCKASLGDKVWSDTDRDGIQDNSETGVANVTVDLYSCANVKLSSMLTDANGNYLFADLTPGDYYVQFTLPSGYQFTTKDAGTNDAVDSDADVSTGKTICTTLSAGENDLTWDAGIYPPCKSTIGDFVWHDKNVNGIQDANEPGIQNVAVELLSGTTVVATSTTKASGLYSFSNVDNGTYTIKIADVNFATGGVLFNTISTKWYASLANQGTNDALDSDGDRTAHTASVIVNCADNPTIDFGFYKTCIGLEKTANVTTAKAGDVITYSFAVSNCGDVTHSGGVDLFDAMLNPSGNNLIKHIDKVLPGETVTYTQNYTVPSDKCGTDIVNTATAEGHPIDGSAYVSATDNATVTIICKASIGDKVWLDTDKDGIQDQGEAGVKEVVVELYKCDNTFISSTTTNEDGNYLFTNLDAGSYYVKFILPSGYTFTTINAGSNDAVDSDADATTGKTICTDLVNGENDLTWDAGLVEPCSGKIGDKVWLDFSTKDAATNCNGLQDAGEAGIAGVKIILKDASSHIVATTTTDENGNYLFTNLCAGCYNVFVDATSLPAGTKEAPIKIGNNNALDNDGSGVQVCLSADNTVDLTIDFGYCYDGCGGCEEACIGDFVWFDANGNGVQDASEIGVANVTVELYNENSYKIATTITGNDGSYGFNNLIPGNYYVKFIAPQGYTFISKDAGSNDEKDSDAGNDGKTVMVLLLAGNCDDSWDAGLVELPPSPSCLGDRVWFDANQNGIQDVSEIGVKDVVVKLVNPATSAVIAEQTTDIYGYYKFDNLSAGSYKIVFALPAGYSFSSKDQGSNEELDSDAGTDGATVVITLATSECQLKWDAGIYAQLPDLKLNKTVDNPNPKVGDPVTFTITVTNEGSVKATGVEVTDYLPTEGLTLNSSNASQGSFVSSTGIWTVGELNAGQSVTLTLTFTVNDLGSSSVFAQFDLGIAKDWNVFVLCSANLPSSDTQCKMAVGWDAYLSNYSIGDQLGSSAANEDVLVVGRDLTYTSGNVYYGNVVYGVSTNLPQSTVSIGGSLIKDPNRVDFNAAGVYLRNLSSQLAYYTVNGTTDFKWGGLTLDGNDPILNVFKVKGSDLSSSNSMTINVPNGAVVVVNIDGSDISWTGGLVVNGTAINNVLYNFYEATYIKIQGIDIRGSILAPCATVNFVSGVQNGQMIAKYLIGHGQFNCEMFLGNIPSRPNITNIAEITKADQKDPDSTPGNGVPSEDDYGTATIYFNGTEEEGSTDGFEQIGNFANNEVIWSITNDNSGNLLVGTAGGHIYKSENNGSSWISMNGNLNVALIWSIAVGTDGTIFAGTEKGVFSSSNNGANWNGPLGGLAYDFHAVAVNHSTGDVYAGSWGMGVFKSTNNGADWKEVNSGLSSPVVNALAIDASGRIYAGTFGGGVYLSEDNGASWNVTSLPFSFIWALDVTSSGVVYAATYGAGVYRSEDNGTSWEEVNTGLEAGFVYGIAINSIDEVYVSTWLGGIYKLGTLGKSTESNNNESTTSGSYWQQVGMSGVGISALMVDRSHNVLYAGGKNGSVYKFRESSTTGVDDKTVVTEYTLSQNYPNPFNPSTTIEFAVPKSEYVSLVLYNVLGQAVKTLVDEQLETGRYSISVNASDLASGVYIYKLSSPSVSITKKMILQK